MLSAAPSLTMAASRSDHRQRQQIGLWFHLMQERTLQLQRPLPFRSNSSSRNKLGLRSLKPLADGKGWTKRLSNVLPLAPQLAGHPMSDAPGFGANFVVQVLDWCLYAQVR